MENAKTQTDVFAREVHDGLSDSPKYLPTRFIYDERGSQLFEQIMELPEYYLTRTEYQILEKARHDLVQHLAQEEFNLVELGAGNGLKTSLLLELFIEKKLNFRYTPIDISADILRQLADTLEKQFPGLEVVPLHMDYFQALQSLKSGHRKNLVLFLGSNIGNMSPEKSVDFLRRLNDHLSPGDWLLTGFDMVKDYDLLNKAYGDSHGITAAFNLNLLHRINRELGGHFDVSQFRFYSFFNPRSSAIESFLVSLKKQSVWIEKTGTEYHFEAWESIHTEYSFKYTRKLIRQLAENAGFRIIKNYIAPKNFFTDSLWEK